MTSCPCSATWNCEVWKTVRSFAGASQSFRQNIIFPVVLTADGNCWHDSWQSKDSGIIPASAGNTYVPTRVSSPCRNHPRSRGDHKAVAHLDHPVAESPPLTRGPHGGHYYAKYDLRITPAHAGTTFRQYCVPSGSADHPRSRGDHEPIRDTLVFVQGSPPLTRGPRPLDDPGPRTVGITPAHAGTTAGDFGNFLDGKDHPRSRGDHFAIGNVGMESQGSPPLTRGPPLSDFPRFSHLRITPAHAGTT